MGLPEVGGVHPAGTWIGERNQPRIDGLPGWTNLAPRLGFAYDVRGDGRTAVKGGYGRYYVQTGTLISQTLNRNGRSDARATWRDLDGNLRITPGPCGNITCSAELGTIPAFSTSNTTYDTDAKRPFDDEFSIGVDHSLTNDLAVSATYELIECVTALATGSAAMAFLGTQGDVWDTQWDMFLALVGCLTSQVLLARAHERHLARLPIAAPPL